MIPDTAIRQPYKTTEERGDCAPLHPGEVLREDLLPHYHLSTADLAMRLGSAFELNSHYWRALQMQYDLWHAPVPVTAGPATQRDMVCSLHAA